MGQETSARNAQEGTEMNTIRAAIAAALLVLLTACGGGDPEPEDGHKPPPTNPCDEVPRPPACA